MFPNHNVVNLDSVVERQISAIDSHLLELCLCKLALTSLQMAYFPVIEVEALLQSVAGRSVLLSVYTYVTLNVEGTD
jgi:hypothetical protein